MSERPRARLSLPHRPARLPRRPARLPVRPRPAAAPSMVTLGDLLLDVVVRPERPVQRATDVPGSITFRVGGAAANTARCAARLGARSVLICGLGRDAWGRRLEEAVAAEGVVVHALRTASATGRLLAIVEPGGERSFITERGAADDLGADDIRPAWLRGAGALHVSAYALFGEPVAAAAVRAAGLAHQAGALVAVDLASHGPMLSLGRELVWARVAAVAPQVILGNREEVATLSGGRGWRRAETLLELAPMVVVKLGAEGCRVLWREAGGVARLDVATAPLTVADTTGAGDAFAAGFLVSLLRLGWAPLTAATLRRAALAGHRAAADVMRRPRPRLDI